MRYDVESEYLFVHCQGLGSEEIMTLGQSGAYSTVHSPVQCMSSRDCLSQERYLHVGIHSTHIALIADVLGFDAHAKDVMPGNALCMLFFLPLMLGSVIGALLVKHAYRSAAINAAFASTTINQMHAHMLAAGTDGVSLWA